MRLNLQLFAKKVTDSIVNDVIRGNYGNGNARKTALAKAGYDYGEVQAAVNAKLKGNSGSSNKANTTKTETKTNTTVSNKPSATPVTTKELDAIPGVDKDTTNNAYNNAWNPESNEELMGYKDKLDSSQGNLEGLLNDAWSIDQATKDALNQKFEVSDAYNQAMQYTNQLLEQLSSGRTSYTDQINDLMNKIQNREDFEYDADKDQLFQQALSSAMRSGQSAMQDTIGQASALTGGYGSTYATSAGNQAYNAFIEDAYNNLPEYYQMAMEAYQMEGQDMYNQLGMLRDADNSEYQRMYNSWDANFKNAQNIWDKDFSTWEASINQAYNSANLQLAERGQQVDEAYKLYSANMDMYNTMYAQTYDSWKSMVDQAQAYAGIMYQVDRDKVADEQWLKTYNQTEKWNQKDLDYKNATLNENKRQFNYSIGDTNNDGKVDEQEQAALNAVKNPSGNNVDALTDSEIKELQTVYANAGGGKAGNTAVDAKLSLWNKNNVDNAALETLLGGTDVPIWKTEWTIHNDTKNGGGGVDHNDVFIDNQGRKYTYDELEELLEDSDLNETEKERFLTKLEKQSKK